MQQLRLVCDRCGKVMSEQEAPVQSRTWFWHASQYVMDENTVYDFCPECKREFRDWIHMEEDQSEG